MPLRFEKGSFYDTLVFLFRDEIVFIEKSKADSFSYVFFMSVE